MKLNRLLLVLLVVATACTPRAPRTIAAPEPTDSPAATSTPTAIATTSPTPIAVATQLSTSGAPSALDADAARHLRIFEQLWNTVESQYVYADFNGVDWPAAYDEFRARIERGLSDEDFWKTMDELVGRLGDDHSTFLSPDRARDEDRQIQGNLSYVGIGIYAAVMTDKQQAAIFAVFPGGPAADAGLRAHDAILDIEGKPAVNADGTDNLDLLRGPSGTEMTLRVRSPGERPREVRLTRRRVNGVLQTSGRVLKIEGDDRRIGYVMIPTLWDASIEDSTRRTLIEIMTGNPLDGLIVDMRTNGGGVSTNLLALLGFFSQGQHGEFASRDQTRPLVVTPEPIGNSQDVPLVILVGPDTQSYAEVFSGVLREAGRARLVGAVSPGNIETIYGYDFEDGSRAWIARETFIPASGADWETEGLVPDVLVDVGWDEFVDEDDPYIAAALALLTVQVGAALP